MKVLVLGSGGREHAISWKVAQSDLITKLYIAPGNAGTDAVGENVNIAVDDFDSIKSFCLESDIDMVLVGPEIPLVNGIVDYFKVNDSLKHINIVGPNREAAQLEGSKDFAKMFMQRHEIPTAQYKTITTFNLSEGEKFLEELTPPYVLKADGLAAGKGVLILDDLKKAKEQLKKLIEGEQFGEASKKVVIEEFLSGIELSVFVLTDGESYKILPSAKDYKRIGEGDTGLNTGGMGAISPVPFADEDFLQKVEDRIIKPTLSGLHKDGIEYNGFIFIGLMNCNNDPFVIEYNVRLGDPETEVVLPRIKTDLVELFNSLPGKKLSEKQIEFDSRTSSTVMLVSGGYPEAYEKGKSITGLEQVNDSIIFHAGTTSENEEVKTSGGRVIAVTSLGEGMEAALQKCYSNAEKIHFDKKYYRKDIGFDLR